MTRSDQLILVADDDQDVLGLVSSRLRRSDFEVLTASDGDEALALALGYRPDVAILDVVMPRLSGHDVTREIRQDPRAAEMQVILLSARTHHQDVVRGFEAGADDYVTKPFSGRELVEHVNAALDRLADIDAVDPALAPGGDEAGIRTQMQDLLLAALAARDGRHELREHVEAVAYLAVPVGRRLGMSDDELQELALAAHLHDVGKLGIPLAVLEKRGPLTDDEWRLMRKHTLVGERILRAAPAMTGVAATVRSCHERWDGSGYPDGLSGDDIPLAARVVFVCDAFSAMTSRRCYTRPRGRREALAELLACAGTAFDPAVVEAFRAHAAASGLVL